MLSLIISVTGTRTLASDGTIYGAKSNIVKPHHRDLFWHLNAQLVLASSPDGHIVIARH